MPKIGRLPVPGGYYHLMGRGIERRYIFRDDADKEIPSFGSATLDHCETMRIILTGKDFQKARQLVSG